MLQRAVLPALTRAVRAAQAVDSQLLLFTPNRALASSSSSYIPQIQHPCCSSSVAAEAAATPGAGALAAAAAVSSGGRSESPLSASRLVLEQSFSQPQRRGFFSSPEPKKWEQRRLVGWSQDQFYQVVSDVDQYHKFVPWCQKSVVVKRAGQEYMEAELEVGFQMLVERYLSKVTMESPRLVRSCVSHSMLFHHLDSSWVMEPGPTPNSCWLTFKVDFAFNSALYGNLADLFFSEVVKQMVGAFEGRAAKKFGASSLIKPRIRSSNLSQGR